MLAASTAPNESAGFCAPRLRVSGLLILVSIALLVSLLAAAHHAWGEHQRRLRESLRVAIDQHNHVAIRRLLARGASPNVCGAMGVTSLVLGLWEHDPLTVRAALDHGANVKAVVCGSPVIIWALGDEAVFTRVVAAGADVNAADKDGITPLMWATRAGRMAEVRVLLQKGAAVNSQEEGERSTALSETFLSERDDIAELLLARGADPRLRDRWGRNALQQARWFEGLTESMLSDPDARDPTSRSWRNHLLESRRRLRLIVRLLEARLR
jgi:ankyrin repeat protein